MKRTVWLIALIVLLAVLAMSACSTQGYVRADAVQDSLTFVCNRHDAYVKADPKLSAGQKNTDLRDTALLRQLFAEAANPSTRTTTTKP